MYGVASWRRATLVIPPSTLFTVHSGDVTVTSPESTVDSGEGGVTVTTANECIGVSPGPRWYIVKLKVKNSNQVGYSTAVATTSLLRELTCHKRSHSVNCHPTEVIFSGGPPPCVAGSAGAVVTPLDSARPCRKNSSQTRRLQRLLTFHGRHGLQMSAHFSAIYNNAISDHLSSTATFGNTVRDRRSRSDRPRYHAYTRWTSLCRCPSRDSARLPR